MTTDLLGHELDPGEAELLTVYTGLKALAARDDVAPCVSANARAALAHIATAVNDLGLDYEHLLDVGV
jgi:hypothetical protein